MVKIGEYAPESEGAGGGSSGHVEEEVKAGGWLGAGGLIIEGVKRLRQAAPSLDTAA